jgi:hypothetical protein
MRLDAHVRQHAAQDHLAVTALRHVHSEIVGLRPENLVRAGVPA